MADFAANTSIAALGNIKLVARKELASLIDPRSFLLREPRVFSVSASAVSEFARHLAPAVSGLARHSCKVGVSHEPHPAISLPLRASDDVAPMSQSKRRPSERVATIHAEASWKHLTSSHGVGGFLEPS